MRSGAILRATMKRADSGRYTYSTGSNSRGKAPPSTSTERQPACGIRAAAAKPTRAEPRLKPVNMAATRKARRRSGTYSDSRGGGWGWAAPRPRPVRKRSAAIWVVSCASGVSRVHRPKPSTEPISTRRRPHQSEDDPASTAPTARPIGAAPITMPKAGREIPHSARMEGATKPMMATSMPSTATMKKHSSTSTHWLGDSARALMNSLTFRVLIALLMRSPSSYSGLVRRGSGVPAQGLAVLAGHRVQGAGGIARLLEVFERLAPHGGIDVQVGHPDHRAQFLQHEEDHAVMDQAAPVALAHQGAFLVAQAGLLKCDLGVGQEGLAVRRHDQPMQKAVQAVGLDAAGQVEGVGAAQAARARQFLGHVGAMPLHLASHRAHRGLVLVDGGGNARHRRQVVALVNLAHIGRQGSTHDQPHDDLGPLQTAQTGKLGLRHAGQALRVLLDQVQKALIPGWVVEAGAFAVHLVRQAARGHHRHFQIVRVALDGTAQRLAQLVATAGRRHGEL